MFHVDNNYPIFFDKIGLRSPRVVSDTHELELEMATGKKVLDIGCTGSDCLVTPEPFLKKLGEVSSYCVGIDIYKDGIEHLKKDGLNVIYADAEDFELPSKDFDLVILGDLIEHVGNPGLVLRNAYNHLKPGGKIIVVTPNAFSVGFFTSNLLRGGYQVNSEHVLWFDPGMLSLLLERMGFKIEELVWTGYDPVFLKRLLQRFRKSLMGTFGIIASKPEVG
jgi:2-polyprenyl-3-methyl-5-hydroxy-6-metoxy-1,4-benzoquinol methylase